MDDWSDNKEKEYLWSGMRDEQTTIAIYIGMEWRQVKNE